LIFYVYNALLYGESLNGILYLDKNMAGTYASLLGESPGRQNLLNAEFASIWYLNDKNENVQEN
jgi:hypothetical protein